MAIHFYFLSGRFWRLLRLWWCDAVVAGRRNSSVGVGSSRVAVVAGIDINATTISSGDPSHGK